MNKSVASLPKKTFAKYRKPLIDLPNMVENQLLSYRNLVDKDIAEILKEFSPIRDYSDKKFELEFLSYEISAPKFDEVYAKENKLSYEAPMRGKIKLTNKLLGTSKEQEWAPEIWKRASTRRSFNDYFWWSRKSKGIIHSPPFSSLSLCSKAWLCPVPIFSQKVLLH